MTTSQINPSMVRLPADRSMPDAIIIAKMQALPPGMVDQHFLAGLGMTEEIWQRALKGYVVPTAALNLIVRRLDSVAVRL